MIVTRWNPTANGALHLGHIYSLLVNEKFAHDNDGKFYVRFDDTSGAITIEMAHKERTVEIIKSQQEIIEWLGIPVDGWIIQSSPLIMKEIEEFMKGYDANFRYPYPHDLPLFVRMVGTGWLPFPYAPYETAERVILDHMIKATHIIRGEEFSGEFSLYRYFCDMFGFPHPKFIFLPRLMAGGGDISKTNGGYTIAELRSQGYKPEDIKDLLRNACLKWYSDDWSIYNLKPNPRISL